MRYAIFDLDGTLVDSMYYWRSFGKYFLESKGVKLKEDFKQITKVAWSDELALTFKKDYNIDRSEERRVGKEC